jgi:hypothetical protein
MSSIREQIAAAIVAAVSGPGAPAGLTVHRERTRPVENEQLPAILIYFEDEQPEPLAGQKFRAPLTERSLGVVAEIRVVPTGGQAPDEAADSLYVWLIQAVGADESFGGLAMGVTEGPVKWFSKEADAIYAGAAVHFIVHYRTKRLDPTAKS